MGLPIEASVVDEDNKIDGDVLDKIEWI